MLQDPPHTLSSWQIAISLISMHYGIGMLIGTGQEIAVNGPAGLLFAFAAGIGILFLLPVTKFYWREKYPLWDLFREKYGNRVAVLTSFLSAFWMIGLIAGFVLGGSAAFKIFGFGQLTSIFLIVIPIYLLSLIQIKNLSKVFTGLLCLGSLFLVAVLVHTDFSQLLRTPLEFAAAVRETSVLTTVSTLISIILITVLGMDFHQFLVRAKDVQAAKNGIYLAGLGLFIITFLIGSAVIAAAPALSEQGESIQVVPRILLATGTALLGQYGVVFMLPILFVAVGSGSGITKIISQSIQDILPRNQVVPAAVLNASILLGAVLFSLTQSSVVELIVSFYAIYISAVLFPFLGYLLEKNGTVTIAPHHFFLAILTGATTATVFFLSTVVLQLELTHTVLYILAIGCSTSAAVLGLTAHINWRKVGD